MKRIRRNSLTLVASLLVTAGYAQVAVDFGGEYRAGGDIRPSKTFAVIEAGDFDGQGDTADTRGYQAPESRTLSITSTTVPPVDPLVKNLVVDYGYQIVALDSTNNPTINDLRFEADGSPDWWRLRSGVVNADITGSFITTVKKENFLNGFDASTNTLSFGNSNSFTVKLRTTGFVDFARAAVKDGGQWYVSGTKTNTVDALTINPFTENWYPVDPDVNLYVFESGGLPTGTPVAGSTISNITALGIFVQGGDATGGTDGNVANILRLDIDAFSVTGLVATEAAGLAVKFGGDYATGNENHNKSALTTEIGDFGVGTVADDLRTYIPFGTALAQDNNGGPDDRDADTTKFFGGYQFTYVDFIGETNAFDAVYRYFGAVTPDTLQYSQGAITNAAADGMVMTAVPYIPKSRFLNGFDDLSQGLAFKAGENNVVVGTLSQKGASTMVLRAVVQNGSSWYISDTSAVGAASTLSFDGAADTWYPYDPDSNMILPALSGGVSGSTFDDIQAVGAAMEYLAAGGSAKNDHIFRLAVLEAGLEPSDLVVDTTASIDIPRLGIPPTLDGVVNPAEWSGAASFEMRWPELGVFPNIGGLKYTAPTNDVDDFEATVYYGWDDDFLYMGLAITDDIVFDGVAEAFKLPNDDDHVLWSVSPFSPSVAAAGTADWTAGNVFATELGMDVTNVVYRSKPGGGYNGGIEKPAPNSTFTGLNVTGGWGFEVAIAWEDLTGNPGYVPAASDKLGQHLLLVDVDSATDANGALRETFLFSAADPIGSDSGQTVNASGWNELVLVEALNLPVDFAEWIGQFDVGSLTEPTDDAEPDGMNNLLEYALGGDPSVDDAATVLPASLVDDSGASNVFAYVYNRWKDAAARGLTYTVERETDLVLETEGWTTNGIGEAIGPAGTAGYESVTNTVPTDVDQRFMRLNVELAE